jgi:hypothetical protein
MISHALTIVMNELNTHLHEAYTSELPQVELGNLAEGLLTGAGGNGLQRNLLYLSVVNITEEKTLKNLPNRFPNDLTLKVTYENPPVFLNLLILLAATHTDYANALLVLSRAIRFFQYKNVFTQDNVAPESITTSSVPIQPLDQLASFKLIFDLYSPTLEEINHLWGTLGGKQYPFVLYIMRMLDLKFKAALSEAGLITEIISNFSHKTG